MKKMIQSLKKGIPTIKEKNASHILQKYINKEFNIDTKMLDFDFDAFVISVGTPLDTNGYPKMEYVKEAGKEIGKKIKKGGLVILRSTVPVGTSRTIVTPIIEEVSGLKSERDFHVVFAPERTVEGIAIQETGI